MRVLRDDSLIKITFDDDRKLLKTYWKPDSFKGASKDNILGIIHQIADDMVSENADYYLADQTDRGVIYTADMQRSIAQVLMEGVKKAGVRKTAIVQPADFIVSLSNEQTINEVKDPEIEYKTFSDYDAACEYLGL